MLAVGKRRGLAQLAGAVALVAMAGSGAGCGNGSTGGHGDSGAYRYCEHARWTGPDAAPESFSCSEQEIQSGRFACDCAGTEMTIEREECDAALRDACQVDPHAGPGYCQYGPGTCWDDGGGFLCRCAETEEAAPVDAGDCEAALAQHCHASPCEDARGSCRPGSTEEPGLYDCDCDYWDGTLEGVKTLSCELALSRCESDCEDSYGRCEAFSESDPSTFSCDCSHYGAVFEPVRARACRDALRLCNPETGCNDSRGVCWYEGEAGYGCYCIDGATASFTFDEFGDHCVNAERSVLDAACGHLGEPEPPEGTCASESGRWSGECERLDAEPGTYSCTCHRVLDGGDSIFVDHVEAESCEQALAMHCPNAV